MNGKPIYRPKPWTLILALVMWAMMIGLVTWLVRS